MIALQVVDASLASSYKRAIQRGDVPVALRIAGQLAMRLGPGWREKIG